MVLAPVVVFIGDLILETCIHFLELLTELGHRDCNRAQRIFVTVFLAIF